MPIPQIRTVKRFEGSLAVDRTRVRTDAGLEGAKRACSPCSRSGRRSPKEAAQSYGFDTTARCPPKGIPSPRVRTALSWRRAASGGGVRRRDIVADAGGKRRRAAVLPDRGRAALCLAGISAGRLPPFFPMETVHRLVDLLAYDKCNRLHLHLSDDQGFRFESERFPLLNSVGSWRESTLVKHGGKAYQDGLPHGGYYTKKSFARSCNMQKRAALRSFPSLTCPATRSPSWRRIPNSRVFPNRRRLQRASG